MRLTAYLADGCHWTVKQQLNECGIHHVHVAALSPGIALRHRIPSLTGNQSEAFWQQNRSFSIKLQHYRTEKKYLLDLWRHRCALRVEICSSRMFSNRVTRRWWVEVISAVSLNPMNKVVNSSCFSRKYFWTVLQRTHWYQILLKWILDFTFCQAIQVLEPKSHPVINPRIESE